MPQIIDGIGLGIIKITNVYM